MFLGGITSLASLSRANSWLRHTDDVRVAIGALRTTMLDAETGARGYIITGDPAVRRPYDRALARWPGELDRVRALTTDNPDQQFRLQRLASLIPRRVELLAVLVAAFDEGKRERALAPIMIDGALVMDEIRAVIGEMEQEEAHLDTIRRDTAVRRWEWTMALFVGGAFTFVILVAMIWSQRRATDVRLVAQLSIDAERRLLQAVLAGIDDGITLQGQGGRLVFANASAARTVGFESPAALMAASMPQLMERFELYAQDGSPMAMDQLPGDAVLKGEPGGTPVLIRHRVKATGVESWASVRAYPVTDASGRVIQAINVFRDVTAERREEERRRFFVRAVGELGSSLDYEETLARVARLAVPALADWCTVELLEGNHIRRVAMAQADPTKLAIVEELERRYPIDPEATTGVRRIIRSGEPVLVPEIPRDVIVSAAADPEHLALIDRLQLRSYLGVPLTVAGTTIGAIVFAMGESRRVYNDDDLRFAQTLADRAALAIENARLFREVEHARARTALELTRETERRHDAENATHFAEMFIGILGHDLRNPINAISMTATLLRRKAAGDARALDRILSSTRRMTSMVGQLLDLTRSRLAGGIAVERRPIDVGAVVSEALDELGHAHPGREIALTLRGPLQALADKDRLAQVVSNLVGNALEHGDSSAPVSVQLLGGDDGGGLCLRVHNSGPPIPADLLPAIFDPFRRTTARDERSRGLGLGLFISQQIVLAHGGTIDVRSAAGEGTTFTVTLPRLSVEKSTLSGEHLVR